jgi:hypothetical protein
MKNNILWVNIPKEGDAHAYDYKKKFKFVLHIKKSRVNYEEKSVNDY